MKSQHIREAFLDFFEKRGHKIVHSSPLLPKDDPTLLFTNAGMNQFKNVFLGLEERSYRRAASVQKCMRVSGKHNDLDTVGRTNKHHTFFEMLGNFSFGDYFKEGAIEFGWEFVTETIELEKDRLYATVYEEDDEAYNIWKDKIGLTEDRIFRFGKKDNFWAMGDTGPCGPCSELHYDLDRDLEEGSPLELIESGSDRFLELWNLVFMQFYQEEEGKRSPLPAPSIDTGMGLERLATILQHKQSNFETDLFLPLIETICDLSQTEYGSKSEDDTALRIIADHVRAVTFLIGDGIMPSNEGRGYVLRRLIRRAYRFGTGLGLEEPFQYRLIGVVCDIMKETYPELLGSAEYISKLCLSEEERFAFTLSSGLKTFNQFIEESKQKGKGILPGNRIFKLYDTFGFPLELSRELAEEQGLQVDEAGFKKELDQQRDLARQAWKGDAQQKEMKIYEPLKGLSIEFTGYEHAVEEESCVLSIVKENKIVKEIIEGDTAEIFLNKTPFYAEAGGQVGDTGVLKNAHFSAVVENTFTPLPGISAHLVKVLAGALKQGDIVEATVDSNRRDSISRNHTATHLLHAALRQILGDHVKQAGSLVAHDRMRFDFTHFAALKENELEQLESIVNSKVRDNIGLETAVMSLEEGLNKGAMAIFEEKYSETVRLVNIPGFSRELCGGIHVHSTGSIGLFKIISESSIASGMRRIEALTGEFALNYITETDNLLKDMQVHLNVSRQDSSAQLERILESFKRLEKENRSIRQKMANTKLESEQDQARLVRDIKVIVKIIEGVDQDELRNLSDSLKQKLGSGIIILGTVLNKKAFITASVTKDLVKRIDAVDVIKKIAPLVKGGGGGRPDFAQAGGADSGSLEKAMDESYSILESLIE
ncbi:alanine--tRNA ligase [Acidobacteriota bacterium]